MGRLENQKVVLSDSASPKILQQLHAGLAFDPVLSFLRDRFDKGL